ncbi:MAG: DUF4856 domain-containing protein [Chitinophagales bacterium]
MRKLSPILAVVTIFFFSVSCNKDDKTSLDIPNTYKFERNGESSVNYENFTQTLNMLAELDAYMQTTRSLNNIVEADTLQNMFDNSNANLSLKNYCYNADESFFNTWLAEIAASSQLNQNASIGVAGHLNEEYPLAGTSESAGYLVNENGIEYQQIITKGLMGAALFYQANEVFFSESGLNANNDAVISGENYTALEHHFDAAFACFGVATDFPTNTEGVRFWGKYCNARNTDTDEFAYPTINDDIMQAFLKGRAAIVAKNDEKLNEAVQTIQEKWAIVIASTAANYLSISLSSTGVATYKKHHQLSEAIAFMMSLAYHFENASSKFSPTYDYSSIENALSIIGLNTNLYEVDDADIDATIAAIQAAFPAGTIQ